MGEMQEEFPETLPETLEETQLAARCCLGPIVIISTESLKG